jgi:hypothetical protein
MLEQHRILFGILQVVAPELALHIGVLKLLVAFLFLVVRHSFCRFLSESIDCSNLVFCFNWILLIFKRQTNSLQEFLR